MSRNGDFVRVIVGPLEITSHRVKRMHSSDPGMELNKTRETVACVREPLLDLHYAYPE